MTLAFSYVRFSADRQQHGASVARQVDAAAQYALAHGLTLDTNTYRDLGISAFKSKNRVEGALGAFIQAVDDKKIPRGSFLLIESFDRLSRDTVDVALELFLNITRKGITIVTLMDQQVYSQATIRDNWTKLIMALAVMARANEESVTKSRRVADSYVRRKEKGEIAHNKYPSWLRKVDKTTFEPIPEKAALINRIFDMAIEGMGSRLIARQLHTEKVPTSQWAKEWNQALVSGLLRSTAVYGCKGDNEKYYPPIMTKKKFMTTVSIVQGRRWKGYGPNSVPNLFAGLSFCSVCGSRVRYVPSGRGNPYIRCKSAIDKLECTGKLYPYNACEEAFIYVMTRKAGLDISGEYIVEHASEAPALQGEIDTLKDKQKRLLKLAALTEGVEAVADELNAVQKQISALEDKLAQVDKVPVSQNELAVHRDLFDRYSADRPNVDLRRQMRVAMARLFKKIEFGVAKDRWTPVIFITLIDGHRAIVNVGDFLGPRSVRAQQKIKV
jgi:DNA invertase Pin-like site-specific DNA recombinase